MRPHTAAGPPAAPDVAALLRQVRDLREAVQDGQRTLLRAWRPYLTRTAYRSSAANLAAYLSLRRHDVRLLQRFLGSLGLTSLSNCEGHVDATLAAVENVLAGLAGARGSSRVAGGAERLGAVAREMGRKQVLLRGNTTQLFGAPSSQRWTRFMVTLPTEAAREYELVRDLLAHGMDVARVNCAHDGPVQWRAMARHVRRAERETGRACRILMDLGGPKLRIGPVVTGKGELHLKVKRDARGRVLRACHVVLDASGEPAGDASPPRIAVSREWLDQVRAGDKVAFTDLRKRARTLVAERRLSPSAVLARLNRAAWLDETTTLEHLTGRDAAAGRQGGNGRNATTVSNGGQATQRPGPIAAAPVEIRVGPGDMLLLTRAPVPGEPARLNRKGKVVFPAHIACSESRVFEALKVGHHVWIDDGKVGAVVETLDEHGAWMRVARARPQGERLAPGKGMNFPDTVLPLPPLSDTDLADLDVAVKLADLVGFSFVRAASDVDELVGELKRRGRGDMGIVAKIETRSALRHLPDVIVHGAGRQPFGIMIARGDLAVEIGYERLAEAQEEILSLCEAAHVPVIWATQVLENLVKQGRPSRAELTDAAMAERAECVMLNKGPYLLQALDVLDAVVTRMQVVLRKKTSQFAPRRWS